MSMLLSNNYKIKCAVPQRQIIAERGSRWLSSVFKGSTKSGHRTVTIEIYPTAQDTIIRLSADFSKFGFSRAYGGAKDDIVEMLRNFVVHLPTEQEAHTISFRTSSCPNCKKELSPECTFCPECGQEVQVACFCFNCGKQISSEVMICPFCGIELKPVKSRIA